MATKNDQPLTEEERQTAEMAARETPATDDVVAADGAEAAASDEPVAAEAPEPPVEKKTARERIAERFNEKRREEVAEATGTIYDQAAAEEPAPAETPAPAPTTEDKPATVAPAATAADEPVVKLTVYGREIELPQSEVVKQAQIALATTTAERALADLNRQIREARETVSKPAPQPTATNGDGRQTTTPTDKAPDKPTQLDRARLAEIVEDMRNGTDEDATQALAKLVTEITEAVKPTAQAQPVDVSRVVSSALAQEREIAAVDAVMDRFRNDYKDVVGDEELSLIVYQRVVGGMLDDMEKAGASAATIAKLRDANPIDVAIKHNQLRNYTMPDGSRPYFDMVRDREALLRDAGEHVRSKYLGTATPPQPTPQPGNGNGLAARTDLKRTLTPQPRTTQHRTQPEAATPPGGKPDPKAAVSRIAALRRGSRSAVGA